MPPSTAVDVFEVLIPCKCINEKEQEIVVYINPTYIVSASPRTHEKFGDIIILDTIRSTFMVKEVYTVADKA